MKHIYFYIFFSVLFSTGLLAQNFKVIDFAEDPNDLSAISSARTDVNDENCAIIKVYTNLDQLFFESRLGIEGDIVQKTGEYWIYVSPREKQLKIIKNGYIPLEYSLPVIIESSKVYKLTLTGGDNNEHVVNYESKTEFVVITTQPEGAQIYINDKLKGVSPLTIPLQEGVYTCRIEQALYKSESFDFDVIGGNTVNINKTLKELDIYGNIWIKSDIKADIYIDNEKVGSHIYEGRLIEGLHIVKIQAENHKTYSKEILVVANKDYIIEEKLEHKTGVLSIQSEPMGASIFIDGVFKGTTPKFVRDVWAGEREISIEKEGFATYKEKVYVESDRTKEYIYKLESARKFTLTTSPSGADVYLNNVLIGKTPLSFELDQSNHNKIKITKEGYHIIYDELPTDSKLKEKNYNLEKHSLAYNADNKSSNTTNNSKPKSRKIREDKKTDFGWSISGLSARPGGLNSSIYGNFGSIHQYGVFLDGGYQFNNYSNSHIDGMVNFPRFSIGASFNLWLWNFAVLEAFAGFGSEYATGLNWENYDIWDMPPDEVHTRYIKLGLRAGFRISPHAELFGSYVLNDTNGPAYDVFGDQVEINGVRYSYHTIFPDRSSQSWEIGIRFVVY